MERRAGWRTRADWKFEQHLLQQLSGPINAIPADINGDTFPDIVALVSQEWEEIWAFINDGRGTLTPRMLWGSTNPDFGSSWMTLVDMDRDGDPDILYANGDAFEYAPPNSRPWQGVQWLENRGDLKFEFHRMIDQQGVTSPEAVDLDGDGDLDVLLVNANNDWDNPAAPSLLWLENDGKMQFTMHSIASSPTHLLTLAVGDLDGDGKPDAVTGGMHISRPYDRIGRITAWLGRHGQHVGGLHSFTVVTSTSLRRAAIQIAAPPTGERARHARQACRTRSSIRSPAALRHREYVPASSGVTPNNSVTSARLVMLAPASPIAIPSPVSVIPWRSTSARISKRDAPSAARTPISRVRSVTLPESRL